MPRKLNPDTLVFRRHDLEHNIQLFKKAMEERGCRILQDFVAEIRLPLLYSRLTSAEVAPVLEEMEKRGIVEVRQFNTGSDCFTGWALKKEQAYVSPPPTMSRYDKHAMFWGMPYE